ncbi:MAG: hypothetical protein B6D61_07395 [Bacteroidetes bacterium 4484_249]|nr:MAG: hypothetical protein B6D61_07395 [Bacteroidetes bacterium 4484_249]
MKTVKYLVFLLFFLPFISISQDSLYYPVDIVYDDVAEQYYVSNWADTYNGYILKLDNEGQIINRFFDNLDFPSGLCLIDNVLYVVNNLDIYGGSLPSFLIGIDLNSGEEIFNTQISTAGTYLDLMTTDNNGNFYIGDSEKNKIYKYNIDNDTVTDFVTDVNNPYGVYYDEINDRILFTNSSFSLSFIKSINPDGGEISTLFYNSGYLEGIILDNSGNHYLSSWGGDYVWGNEPVYKTNSTFGWKYEISNNHNRPFGMCFGKDSVLVVCNWGDHSLSFLNGQNANPPLNKPFDIAFDYNSYRYFLTNSSTDDFLTTGNLSTIKVPGDSVYSFYDNLDHPTGLYIDDSILYVLNNTSPYELSTSYLIAINLNTNQVVMETEIESSDSFLQFLTKDTTNNLYITDKLKNKIIKFDLNSQSVSDFITGIQSPSGIVYNMYDNKFVFTSYSDENSESYIITSDLNGNITDTTATLETELRDVAMVDSSYYLVSDITNNKIYKFYRSLDEFTIIDVNYAEPNGLSYNRYTKDIGVTYFSNELSFIDFSVFGIFNPYSISSDIKVYPNPNNGIFNIELEDLKEKSIDIRVFDLSGIQIYHKQETVFKTSPTLPINLNDVGKGMYILQIIAGKRLYQNKVIVR